MELGGAGDHKVHLVAAMLLSMLLIVSTAECVEELLDIRLEVQMALVGMLLHNHLTLTMSMESASPMEDLVTTSGPMLLVGLKEPTLSKVSTVHAANLMIPVMHSYLNMLETTTTVNQAIQLVHSLKGTSTVMTHSGMGSSVKVSAAVMGNLLHGSVWSYPTHQLMTLRCAFAVLSLMILLYSC